MYSMIATSALGIRRKKTGLALLTNGDANESRRKGPSRKGARRVQDKGRESIESSSSIHSTGGSALVYTSPRRLDTTMEQEEEAPQGSSLTLLSNPTLRWEHMSELAGTHRQDPTVLDVSNRNMPPSALKFGVPPTVAHAVVDLRFGSVGQHDLPEFLDVVSTLFPNLKRMSLQRNHRPPPDPVPNTTTCTTMMEPKNTIKTDSRLADPGPACIFEPSASLLAAADREAARMQRLYILYRLADLEELNDTPVSEEERRLARPNCPSGHRVKRGDWLTGAMAPTSLHDVSVSCPEEDTSSLDDSIIGVDDEDIILNRFMEPIAEEDYPDHELDAVEVTLCGLVTRVKVSSSAEQQSCETERIRTVSPIHASFMEEDSHTIKPERRHSSDFDDTTATTTTCGSHSPQSSLDTIPGTETLAVRLNASHSLSSPFPIQFRGDSKQKNMMRNSPPQRRVASDIPKESPYPRQQARSNHPYPIPIQQARTVPCHIRMLPSSSSSSSATTMVPKSKPPLPSIGTKVGTAVVSPIMGAAEKSLVDGSLSQTTTLKTRTTANHPKSIPRQSRPPPSPASTLRRVPVVALKAPKARRRRWSRKNALATAPSIVDNDDTDSDEEQSL